MKTNYNLNELYQISEMRILPKLGGGEGNELIHLPYITHTHAQIHNIQVDEDLNIKVRTLNILKGGIRNIFLL